MWKHSRIFICTIFLACSHSEAHRTPPYDQNRAEKTTVINSEILSRTTPPTPLSLSRLSEESLKKIQMTDATSGWITSRDGALYKTVDGGNNWRKVTDINIPEHGYITDVSFVDSSGWVSISKT